jgi:hypothetical protein
MVESGIGAILAAGYVNVAQGGYVYDFVINVVPDGCEAANS